MPDRPNAASVPEGLGEWALQGACRGKDPDLWFPPARPGGRDDYIEARIVCTGCPVRVECLRHAVAHHEKVGMWGGTTPDERRYVRIRNARLRSLGRVR